MLSPSFLYIISGFPNTLLPISSTLFMPESRTSLTLRTTDVMPSILPKSLLGVAVKYALNQWEKLVRFLEDGRIEISNNRAERSIKPFVIGRKNWLFANTPKGAHASAIIYSIVETAKENLLDPYAYLTHLFEKLPNMDCNSIEALDQLLPWNVRLQ